MPPAARRHRTPHRRPAWARHPPRWCSSERAAAPGGDQRARAVHAADRQRQLHPGGARGEAPQRPRQHPRPGRGVRPRARLDRGRRQGDRPVGAHRRPPHLPAPVPRRGAVRGRHRVLLRRVRQRRPGAGRERPARGLGPAPGVPPAGRPVHRTRPGRRQRGADPRPCRPAGRDVGPGGRHRGRRGPRPLHGRDPRHGQHAELRPQPAVQPRPPGHPRLLGPAVGRRPRPAAQPRDLRQLPARLAVQGDRLGRRTRGRIHPRDRHPGPAGTAAAQQLAGDPQLQRLGLQQLRRAVADRRAHHLLQHRLRPARHGPRRGPGPRDGRGVRHGRRDVRHPAAGRGQQHRRGRGRGRAGADLDRPARRAHDPAAGGAGRRDRGQRRRADAALPGGPGAGPRPDGHRLDAAGGVARRGLVGRRKPADRDDEERGGQRLRPRRPHPRRGGGREDGHRAGERRRPGPHLVHGVRPGRRPEDRRRGLRRQRRGHRRRAVGTDRPPGHGGLPRRAGRGLMKLSTGSLLAGRYEIVAPIAVGGMGEVWKARDQVLDRIVAAKVLKTEYTNDPSFLARFRNEARHTAALTHPNIASVYDYGETVDDTGTQQLAFLVMEFVEGEPLVTILHEQGALPVDWTLHVLSQSAHGLSAAHKAGVVHRDIKPGNLMVRPDGVVKLTDFGIAQARDTTPLTRTGMVVGTAQYLSPEQAQGMEVTAASDVYSLGVVAFECLAGARPFDGASQVAIALAHINRPPPPLPAHVPPAVRLLVERALAKDPADRFPDGAAFAEAIRRVAAGGTLAPVAGPVTRPTQIVAGAGLADSATQVIPATGATAVAGAGAMGTAPSGPMPPLQAPPGDDDWYRDEEPGDERSRSRKKWAWIAAALVLVLLLSGGAWYLLGSGNRGEGGDATDRTSSSASASSGPAGVVLDAAAYIGRPADEVRAELEGAGLVVEEDAADEEQLASSGLELAAGDVAALDPSGGTVPAGSEVTLFVAEEAFSPGGDEEEEPAPVPTTSAPPATTSRPAPTTAPTTPPTPATSTTPAPETSTPLGGTVEPPPPTEETVDPGAAAPSGTE